MAKPPELRKIYREDVKDAPDWIEIFIVTLNQFFESVKNALDKNLNFRDNFDGQIKEFSITAGSSPTSNKYKINLNMKRKPDGLIILNVVEKSAVYSPLSSVPYINYQTEAGLIIINSILGLTEGKTYEFKVLIV